jgi:RNA polymerase sigma-70 factor (ECF subfamily)
MSSGAYHQNDFIKELDEAAFENLFKTHYASLVVYANSFLKDGDAAQDVVQGVFVRLWERRADYNISRPMGYLLQAVRNRCLDELKEKKRFKGLENLRLSEREDDTMLLNEEMLEKVQKVIAKLPEKRQKIFRMNRFEGLKYREIAVMLGLSVKTVEAQMGKALRFLKENIPLAVADMQEINHASN